MPEWPPSGMPNGIVSYASRLVPALRDLGHEVFVLTHGRGVLFIDDDENIRIFDMEPGIIYNVTNGTWHSVIGTRESSWLIVESNDTSEENTDFRELSAEELETLRKQYPEWLR